MAEQQAAAFLSYVHSDDKYGHITKLRELLGDEARMAIGAEFDIFQDRKDIGWGQNWKQRLEASLDSVIFLIPVVTPSFFNSEHCRGELQRFLEREKSLGRNDLIFPVYYIDTPLFNEDELRAADELAQALASRQYADWRELRFEPFTNPQVGKTLERLARQIRDALPHVRTVKPPAAPPRPVAETQHTNSPTREGGEQVAQRPSAKSEPPTCTVHPMPHRGDFTTIGAAMQKSDPGTKIIVRPGLYEEGLVIDKPLEIIGEGTPGDVVVKASGQDVIRFQTSMGRVTNLRLMQVGGESWYAVNIVQGRLELEDCDITSQSLACVGIQASADPRLRRNRIHDGKASGVHVFKGGLGTLEDNDIFANALAGVGVTSGGSPTLRRNRIYDGKENGVLVYDGGFGTLEDNDIYGNTYAGVAVTSGSNPTLRRNRIHDNTENGVHIFEAGLGVLENNDIYGNDFAGVEVTGKSSPTLRDNKVNKNGLSAIWVYDEGGGTFEGNDLRGNKSGAWDVAADCQANVKRSDNQE